MLFDRNTNITASEAMTKAKAGLNAAGGKIAPENKRPFAKRTAKKGKAELRAMTNAKVNYNTADVGRQSQNKKNLLSGNGFSNRSRKEKIYPKGGGSDGLSVLQIQESGE